MDKQLISSLEKSQDSTQVDDLKNALDESSSRNRTLFMFFLLVQVYFLITVGGTTDLNLLLPKSGFKLPIIDLTVPIFAFYLCAPVFLLSLHLNLLINLLEHSRKLYAWIDRSGEDKKLTLYPFLMNVLVNYKKGELNYFLLRFIVSTLVIILPLFLFLMIQVRFSDYHSLKTTVFHFICVITDVFIVGIYWTRISHPELLVDTYNYWSELKKTRPFQSQTIMFAYRLMLILPLGSGLGLLGYGLLSSYQKFFPLWVMPVLCAFTFSFIQERIIQCWKQIEVEASVRQNQKKIILTFLVSKLSDRKTLVTVTAYILLITLPLMIGFKNLGLMLIYIIPVYWFVTLTGTRYIFLNRHTHHSWVKLLMKTLMINAFIIGWPVICVLSAVLRNIKKNNDAAVTNGIAFFALFNLIALVTTIYYYEPGPPAGVGYSLNLPRTRLIFIPHLNLAEQRIVNFTEESQMGIAVPGDKEGTEFDNWLKHYKTINLRGRDLKCAVFTKATLYNVDLREANLLGADLRSSCFDGSDFSNANMRNADLSSSHLQNVKMFATHLEGAKLSKALLVNANLRSVSLKRANLQSANLQGSTMQSARLNGSNFSYARLEGLNLDNAHLKEAKFNHAHMDGVNFFSARDLSTADFEGTELNACRFSSFAQIKSHIRHSLVGCELNIQTVADEDGLDKAVKAIEIMFKEASDICRLNVIGVSDGRWIVIKSAGYYKKGKQILVDNKNDPNRTLRNELEKPKADQDIEKIIRKLSVINDYRLMMLSNSLVDYIPEKEYRNLHPILKKQLIFWRFDQSLEPFWNDRRILACRNKFARKGIEAQNQYFSMAYENLVDKGLESYLKACQLKK